MIVIDMLVDAMHLRHNQDEVDDGLQEEDMRAVVSTLYEQAGALGSEWPGTKDNKAINKHVARHEEYNKAKAKETRVNTEEAMGNDAAEAARPGGGKRKIDELAGRLGKAGVSNNRMLESDEE